VHRQGVGQQGRERLGARKELVRHACYCDVTQRYVSKMLYSNQVEFV